MFEIDKDRFLKRWFWQKNKKAILYQKYETAMKRKIQHYIAKQATQKKRIFPAAFERNEIAV